MKLFGEFSLQHILIPISLYRLVLIDRVVFVLFKNNLNVLLDEIVEQLGVLYACERVSKTHT